MQDDRIEGLGIRTKLLVLVVLASLVPAALVGAAAYLSARRLVLTDLRERLRQEAESVAQVVDGYFMQLTGEVETFAANSLLSQHLANLARLAGWLPPDDDRPAVEIDVGAFLEELLSRSQPYQDLVLSDIDGAVVASASGNPVSVPLVSAQRAVEIVQLPGRGSHCLIQRQVLAPDDRPLGTLTALSDLGELWQRLEDTASTLEGRLWLTDETGGVLWRVSTLDSSAELGAPERLVECLEGSDRAAAFFRWGQREHLATCRLGGLPLGVIVELERGEALSSALALRDSIIGISAFVTLIVALIGYLLGRSLTQPLTDLIAGARAIGEGELGHRVPAHRRDEVGYLARVFNHMSARVESSQLRLERLSVIDELTSLYNRRHLDRALHRLVQRTVMGGAPFSVLMIDLDHFKQYNDRYGHQAGDRALSRTGELLGRELRPTDTAARYGGEEFTVLLPDADVGDAKLIADRLRQRLAEDLQIEGAGLTCSIGVASCPRHGVTDEVLIKAADAALYSAKAEGRDRVVVAGQEKQS